MRYLPLTDPDRDAMLRVIGAPSIDALFGDVPEEARLTGPIRDLPDHMPEMLVERHFSDLARRNSAAANHPFFLGCGAYRHHVPASVDHLIQRGEFLTAYTPYQPEIAQGTLQVLFEFQTWLGMSPAEREARELICFRGMDGRTPEGPARQALPR